MRLSVVRYAVIRCPSASIDSRGEHDIASPFATASYVAQILGHFTPIKLSLIEGDRPNAIYVFYYYYYFRLVVQRVIRTHSS